MQSPASSRPKLEILSPSEQNSYKDIRNVLNAFYMTYNPEKASTIDTILDRYEGNNLQLIKHLKEKYNIGKFEPFDAYVEYNRTNSSSPSPGSMNNISSKSDSAALRPNAHHDSPQRADASKSATPLDDRESHAVTEKRLRLMEISKREVEDQLELATRQANTKHKQLVAAIKLTHQLSAQLRYLSSKAHQSLEEGPSDTQTATSIASSTGSDNTNHTLPVSKEICVDCEKYGILCHKLNIASIQPLIPSSSLRVDTVNTTVVVNPIADDNHHDDDTELGSIIVDVNYSQSNTSDAQADNLAVDVEQQASLILDLRAMIRSLHSAYTTSRLELKLAIQEGSLHERRAMTQQEQIDDLQSKLNKLSNELTTASGSADSMKKQISEANTEIDRYKVQVKSMQNQINDLETKYKQSEDDVKVMKESLIASEVSKQDLAKIYSQQIKISETDAMEYIQSLSERLLLEREDMTARMTMVFEHDRDVRGIFQLEIQREMHRLREELLKSRRAEGQREREMAFLQTQLIDAVERIATLDSKLKSLEDSKKQLEELQAALSAAAASSAIAANSIKAFNNWKPKLGK